MSLPQCMEANEARQSVTATAKRLQLLTKRLETVSDCDSIETSRDACRVYAGAFEGGRIKAQHRASPYSKAVSLNCVAWQIAKPLEL